MGGTGASDDDILITPIDCVFMLVKMIDDSGAYLQSLVKRCHAKNHAVIFFSRP